MHISESKITFGEKFGYGLGDLASNLFWMQFVWFLNYFYTDVFGLAPTVLATMILVVRIWDSVNDPIVGIIADRTNSRWGKFRPYLLWGAIPFGIVGALTFTTPNFSPAGKLTYAYITYASMVLIYTIVNIPYSSLMGVVSSDPKVRTSFSQMRFIMAFTGGLIVQAATLPMVANFGAADQSVIAAKLTPDQVVVVVENGNGSSRLEVTALTEEYKEPEFWQGLWWKVSGLVNEEDLGKFTQKKTFYVNSESYYEESKIDHAATTDQDAFEKIRYAVSGFGQINIDLEKVFPPDSEKFKRIDLAQAEISVKVVNEQKGFQWAMTVFAVTAAVLFVVTFATTKERVTPPKGQKSSLLQDVTDLVSNKPWLILFALGIITLFHVCLRNGAIMYYFKYNIGNTKIAPLFMLAGTFANLVSIFAVGWIERKFGKKKGYAFLMLITMFLTFAFYFVPESNLTMIFVVHILINLMFGPTGALVWAMYTDAADYSEWRTGRRATGLVMSACTMAQKFGYTLGGALGMVLLTYIGYKANAVQTAKSLAGIKGMVSWMSAIPCAIGFVLILFYPLTERKLNTIEADLKLRRQGESDQQPEVS
jgi:GPH family glycoside/pentoside/hexuronide:cation symporter